MPQTAADSKQKLYVGKGGSLKMSNQKTLTYTILNFCKSYTVKHTLVSNNLLWRLLSEYNVCVKEKKNKNSDP